MEELLIRFEQPWGCYNEGEKAGFDEVRAKEFAKKKIAVILGKPDKTPKPNIPAKEVPGAGLVPVVFLKQDSNYNPGDVAGFSSELASKLVANEIAEYFAVKAETKAKEVKIVEEKEEKAKEEKPVKKAKKSKR